MGSVSTSEFLVASAASIGFMLNLGNESVSWKVVLALLAGGAIAAPFAAFMVRHMAPRVLGTGVGGLIAITNVRTLMNVFGWSDAARWAVYVIVIVVWIAAVTVAVRGHRRAVEERIEAAIAAEEDADATGLTVRTA